MACCFRFSSLRYFFVLALSLLSATLAGAADQRMTPELLWKLGRVSGASVAPAGEQVVWTVRHFDLAANAGTSDLMISNLDAPEERKLLSGWKSISDVQWTSVDGVETLWFVGSREGQEPASPQLYRIAAEALTGSDLIEPFQVTRFADGASNVKLAPNGRIFACTFDVKLDPTVQELYADLPQADARIIDQLMYRHWNAWHDYAYSHLHACPIGPDGLAGEPVDLMKDEKLDCPVPPFGGSEQFAWHPNSTDIVYTVKIAEHMAESTDTQIWVRSVETPDMAFHVSQDRPGYDTEPFFNADGSLLAFHSMVRPGFEADRNRVMQYDQKTHSLTELTADLDQSAAGTRYTEDGGIVFASDYRGTIQLFHRAVNGTLTQLTDGDADWSLVELLPGSKTAVVTMHTMVRPDEVYLLNLESRELTAISHANDEIYASLELPTFERRMVKGTDGAEIMCWVIYPPGFDPSKKWPLLLYCQGGPQSQISQFFSYRWNFHLMAANDYVVIAPNRRGLPGFGQDWNDQISGDWGGQAMQDLLSATDDISQEPYIDTQRRGAVGASFGGYSVYWLMGNHQGRFHSMIAHCGVFNLESMYGSTEELFFVNWDLGGPYWKSPEIAALYEKFSPHRFVGNWDTPLLVIHGELDFRVPVTQGMEAFTAAQVQRVPSRFLYFPGEGHWVQKPQNSVLWHRVFFDWLSRSGLQDEPAQR